jgi:hypothetical protein
MNSKSCRKAAGTSVIVDFFMRLSAPKNNKVGSYIHLENFGLK